MLRDVHATRRPRVVLGLRAQDPVPEWITHVADADAAPLAAWTGPKQAWRPAAAAPALPLLSAVAAPGAAAGQGEVLVDMKNVNVAYHERKVCSFVRIFSHSPLIICPQVLQDITWTIRAGERWHLQGSNGP